MDEILKQWASARGYLIAWGPADRARDAREEIRRRRNEGELAAELVAGELSSALESDPPPHDATVIVVVKPRGASRVRFELEDGVIETLLPPTYERYRGVFEDVRRDLAENALAGHRVDHYHGPLKAVAARLGVVRYGRNNITYAGGAGSYIQLCGYLTDAPLASPAAFSSPRLLDECDGCVACTRVCPTRAIDSDRVLIHAERCVTFLNEMPGEWPEWLPARAHSCIVGCLLCQRACPANPKLPVEETGVVFSREESRALIESREAPSGNGESGIRTKLAQLGQPSLEPVLGRNLRALVARRRGAGPL